MLSQITDQNQNIIDLHMTSIIYDLFMIITPPQDAHKRLVLQVYPGSNNLEPKRGLCDLHVTNSAPSADDIPAMIALGAVANIAGPNGSRQVAVEDFCTGPGRNVLAPGEILVSVTMPAPLPNSGANYLRFIPRNEMDIAVAGVGSSVVLDAAGQNFVSARIALASVAPTPVFCREASNSLAGKPVSDESINAAAELAMADAKPINDMRGTIRQRVHLVGVLTRRTLNTAVKRARGEE